MFKPWQSVAIFFCGLGLAWPAFAAPLAPEDAILSDELLAVSHARSFFRTAGLVGTGGLWSVETEVGHALAPRSYLSFMAARSQLNADATNEFWANGQTWAFGVFAAGLSGIYGFGPGSETYYGGLLSFSIPSGDFRFKVQSGLLRFELPDVAVNGSPLRTYQIPIRGEIGVWFTRQFLMSLGAATYHYTVNRSDLASVLGTTTQTTGVGILSGFPLSQFFLRSEFYPANDLMAVVSFSSALSAYQTNRVFAVSGKLEWEINTEWTFGAEVSLSRTGTSQANIAFGPSLFCRW